MRVKDGRSKMLYFDDAEQESSHDINQLIDVVVCDGPDGFVYRDIKIELEENYDELDDTTSTAVVIVINTYDQPREEYGSEYISANPYALKFNMDLGNEGIEFPTDPDTMW